jgi:hypothetical protein
MKIEEIKEGIEDWFQLLIIPIRASSLV